MRKVIVALLALAIAGCATQSYRDTQQGKFRGSLDVRWVKNDYFLFLPNGDDPLTFKRPNGKDIQPEAMYTDGGSIPRFLWGVKGYSPWGYAPAYIVHDWMFEAKHCGYSSDNQYTFEDSVAVMAESLKAIMEQDKKVRNYFVFDSVVAAIGSPIAKRLWEKGSCKEPSFAIESFRLKALQEGVAGDLLMTIKFE